MDGFEDIREILSKAIIYSMALLSNLSLLMKMRWDDGILPSRAR
jgi:hypothetical protein